MRFEKHRYIAVPGVLPELAQSGHDALGRHLFGLLWDVLVAEHADIRGFQLMCEIDEPFGLAQLRGSYASFGLVEAGRGAKVDDAEVERSQIAQCLLQAAGAELRPLREVHLTLQAAQLDGGVSQLKACSRIRFHSHAGSPEWKTQPAVASAA